MVLAKTIKGFGMGRVGEGAMTAHQLKRLDMEVLREMRTRFDIPLSDEEVEELPLYRPPEDSPEIRYLLQRRRRGGFVPERSEAAAPSEPPRRGCSRSSTRAAAAAAPRPPWCWCASSPSCCATPGWGASSCPWSPTRPAPSAMEALFRQYGIYSRIGQLYEPVDSESLTYYREARDGQLIEEGITEAGALSTFIASGTSYSTHGVPTLPFYVFYSIFGFQRVGDLIWAAGDQRAGVPHRRHLGPHHPQRRGPAAPGRTQPHRRLRLSPRDRLRPRPRLRGGRHRRGGDPPHAAQGEPVIYYLTVTNASYEMPPMPEGAREGILKGMYRLRPTAHPRRKKKAHLFGSGAILMEVLEAQRLLEEEYGVAADVWSVTSFKQLHQEGADAERWNLLHPGEAPRAPYVQQCLEGETGAFVVASDYVKSLPNSVARWFPSPPVALGTDGFGRSESRAALRRFFEVDAAMIAYAALADLTRQGMLEAKVVRRAREALEIEDRGNPEHW